MSIPRFSAGALALAITLMACRPAACSAIEPGRADAVASLGVADLRCEYLVKPLGIDVRAPRLSWKLRAVRPGARGLGQSAYRILFASSEERLPQDIGGLLGFGHVAVDQSLPYAAGGPAPGS